MKRTTEKRADMELQVARSAETAKDALRRWPDSSRQIELLVEEAQGLKSQFSLTIMACDLALVK